MISSVTKEMVPKTSRRFSNYSNWGTQNVSTLQIWSQSDQQSETTCLRKNHNNKPTEGLNTAKINNLNMQRNFQFQFHSFYPSIHPSPEKEQVFLDQDKCSVFTRRLLFVIWITAAETDFHTHHQTYRHTALSSPIMRSPILCREIGLLMVYHC